MAFKEISLVLTTSEQDIVVVEADRQAIARFTITNNNGSSARTYTLKHYKASTATTVTLRNAFNINALSAVDIPAITMSEGDKIIALASAASDVVISGSYHDTAKAIPFAVAGIDGVDPGYPWNFRDKTDVEEPDAVGDLNFNNAVLADVTKIVLSAQSSGAGNPDLSDIIESWDDSGESANRGRLLLKNRNAPAQTAEFRLTGTVTYHDEAIDWYELDVEFIGGPGLSTDAELSVQFYDAGKEGAAGVSGASAMTKVDVVDAGDGSPAPDTDYEDGDEIDGVTLEANMLVLRASASDPELNGVYVVPVSGAASRHTDFDNFDDLPGSEFNVLSGDTYGGTKWRCFSEKGGTIDTDPVTINQVTSMDGTQNLADVSDATEAFNNIKQDATTSYKGVSQRASTTVARTRTNDTDHVTPAGIDAAIEAAPDIRRNRIINGSPHWSQQNGTTGGTTNLYYAADQWYMHQSHGGTSTFAMVASASPAGGPNRLRVTVTAQDASLGSSDFLAICQDLEGLYVADFLWGTADAKPAIVRIGMKGPAGTYCVSINNPAFDRSFIAEVVISGGEAGTDVVKEVAIPAQTGGTWLTSAAKAWTFGICLMCGSDRQSSAGWQSNSASNKYATSNQTNWMGNSNSTTFEIFDVGLKMDVGGIEQYGAYEVPDAIDQYFKCRRYYRADVDPPLRGVLTSGGATAARMGMPIFPPMRTAPTASISGTLSVYDGVGSANVSSISSTYTLAASLEFDFSLASSLTLGNPAMMYKNAGGIILSSARM